MRIQLRALFALIAILCLLSPAVAQTNFTGNATLNAGDTTYDGQDITVTGCTLTINGPHSFKSLSLKGAKITHSRQEDANYSGGLNLTITGDCSIDGGSQIDVTSQGYAAGAGPGRGRIGFGDGGGGAAHGGEGGFLVYRTSGTVYDNLRTPSQPGSGGGYGFGDPDNDSGGRGGGVVLLRVGGTLLVNGGLTANGVYGIDINGNSSVHGGGGSGGSISLTVGKIAGAGYIQALGANGNNRGGGGGGGRIALYYTDKADYVGSLYAYGGRSGYPNNPAGAGTIFFKSSTQTNGDLLIDNGGQAISAPRTVLSGPQIFDNIKTRQGGALGPLPGQILDLTVTQDVNVGPNSSINAYGRGYPGSQGPGRGADVASGEGGGGAFGGEANNSYYGNNDAVYGDLRDPNSPDAQAAGTHLGSGGGYGNGDPDNTPGGVGGGAIRLNVTGALQVDGTIDAGGDISRNVTGNNVDYPSGGSGGSVYLKVGELRGAGNVYANGVYGSSGGRIALYYASRTGNVTLSADGGAAGTIFLFRNGQTYGDLLIKNGNSALATILEGHQTFENVTVQNRGWLGPHPRQTLDLVVSNDCLIEQYGILGATGRGYAGGKGPGIGDNGLSNNDGGGGGGYGGKGGVSWNQTNFGGKAYGDQFVPTDFGSGGGYAFNNPIYFGGAGGGAVRLTVNGTLTVTNHGSLSSNGSSGNYGGGGSGGSLLLRAAKLTGNSVIQADGGSGEYGGGGAGGRVALYYGDKSEFTGTIEATGNFCQNNPALVAEFGTVYLEQFTGTPDITLTVGTTTLGNGQGTSGAINLTSPAPEGGLTFTISNSDPSALTVPATVTVEGGSTVGTFAITARNVSSSRIATLTVRRFDQVSGKSITVTPWLKGVRFSPGSVGPNVTVTGLLQLNVGSNGVTVNLASDDPSVTVPTSVTIPPGTTQKTFSVTVGSVSAAKTVNITLTYNGETLVGKLYVNPGGPQLKSVTIAPATVLGGSRVFGVVTLTGKAPTGGAIVALTSSNAAAAVPASVTVPAGRSSASFQITTRQVPSSTTVLITGGLGVEKSATLIISTVAVRDLQLIPDVVFGGDSSVGIVTLDSPAPAPVVVTIASSDPAAIPDAAIIIPTGETTGTFYIDTATISSPVNATISARANGNAPKSRVLKITP